MKKGLLDPVLKIAAILTLAVLPGAAARAEVPQAELPVRFSADKPQLLVTAEYMTVAELTDPKLMALLKKYDVLVAPCIRDYQLTTEAGQKELDRLFTVYEREGIQLVF